MTVWVCTRIEVLSAVWRRHRSGGLDAAALRQAEGRLARLVEQWHEVDAVGPVADEGERVVRTHALRAGDSLQLGAALVSVDRRPRRRRFVCLDDTLLEAARLEGFEVVRPS